MTDIAVAVAKQFIFLSQLSSVLLALSKLLGDQAGDDQGGLNMVGTSCAEVLKERTPKLPGVVTTSEGNKVQ